jgi:hypothetical protein
MIITVVLVVLVLAAVGYVLVSRMTGQPVNTRRLLVLHAVLTAIGALQLAGARVRRVPALDAVLLAVGLLAAAGLGVARGATVAVFGRDGGALAAVPTGGRRRRVDHSMAPHLKAAVIPSPPGGWSVVRVDASSTTSQVAAVEHHFLRD